MSKSIATPSMYICHDYTPIRHAESDGLRLTSSAHNNIAIHTHMTMCKNCVCFVCKIIPLNAKTNHNNIIWKLLITPSLLKNHPTPTAVSIHALEYQHVTASKSGPALYSNEVSHLQLTRLWLWRCISSKFGQRRGSSSISVWLWSDPGYIETSWTISYKLSNKLLF